MKDNEIKAHRTHYVSAGFRLLFSGTFCFCFRTSLFIDLLSGLFIERRIERIKIFAVQMVGRNPQAFTEALVVNNLSLA